MKVLLTGADGYIGAVLGPVLIRHGHHVVGLDSGYYRSGWLYNDPRPRPLTITADIRRIEPELLRGFDAVIHLAELSNDPLGEHDPETTFDINHRGSVRLAAAAREAGVPRFVYTSSCSVYGAGANSVRDEESEPNPQTAYAQCKVLVERDLRELANARFAPVFLRNATAFGASPRMRFDIVLNNLAGFAWTTREIKMLSDGTPWRPLVHVEDICRAVLCCLDAPAETISGETFNVGSDEQNYRIREVAEIVAEAFPGCATSFGQPSGDNRSYQVSFRKIHEHLPGFRCEWNAARGARQLRAVFERIQLSSEMFEAAPFTRLKMLKRLLETGQLDSQFYWGAFDPVEAIA